MAIAIAAGGVEVSDGVLGTHIADRMASVKIEQRSNEFYQTIEEAVQDIGKEAGGKVQK